MNDSSKDKQSAESESKPETKEAISPENEESQKRPRAMSAVARGRGGPNDPEDK